jgi:methionyl-tRNA synthetase
LIKDGLTDVSFSRDKEHLPWGIPVPGDENQVLYVWPDALTNYLTGIGYPDRKYKKFWPADLHVVGKDMLRFHTGIWPGMLLSAGIELPKQVIVHGFLTVDGQKMSKSLGNVVSPLELRKKYNSDSIRYYLARTIPFGEDGDFSEKHLIERHNNELANKLGNLVSRVSALIETNGMQKTPNKLIKKLRQKEIESHMEKYEFDKALNLVFEFIDTLNEHIQEKKPWETKDKKTLYELADSIKVISILLWSFIPSASGKISETFNFKIGYNEIKKPLAIKAVKKPGILFNKIEIGNQKIDKLQNPAPKMVEGIASIVDFTDWQKLDLRVGEIQQVEDIPGADKLYKITVNIGEIRTVCAGLKQFYSKEDLRGKKIILFTNLAPRKMKGIESQGMILAAVNKNETKVSLIQPDEDIEVGSRVM